jgi:hypothetical protein
MGNQTFFAAANPWTPGTYNPGQGVSADVSAGQLGSVSLTGNLPVWNVAHPFFWFAAFAAATAVLIGSSTSLRVGRERLKVSTGDKKE